VELDSNTVVVFMSDNGGAGRSSSGAEPNAPLKSGKGSVYEGGIRVPMIVRWPGVTTGDAVCDYPVIVEDLFPTILNIAKVSVQGQQGAVYGLDGARMLDGALDGASLVSLLQGHPTPDPRPLHWHVPHAWEGLDEVYDGPGIGPSSAVRRGPWKLVYWHADQRKELYNLDDDIGETANLAAEHPDIVSELSANLGAYLREVHALMPTSKRTGLSIPYPDE
jgi:arylsulfatase A-like enzyme